MQIKIPFLLISYHYEEVILKGICGNYFCRTLYNIYDTSQLLPSIRYPNRVLDFYKLQWSFRSYTFYQRYINSRTLDYLLSTRVLSYITSTDDIYTLAVFWFMYIQPGSDRRDRKMFLIYTRSSCYTHFTRKPGYILCSRFSNLTLTERVKRKYVSQQTYRITSIFWKFMIRFCFFSNFSIIINTLRK